MRRVRFLLFFVVLNLFWSFVFGGIKYYIRPLVSSQQIGLETIAGWLATGGVVAYVLGGALVASYHRWLILVSSALLVAGALVGGRLMGYEHLLLTATLVMIVGGGYNLWTVLKGVIITELIATRILSHTAINSIATITLLVGVIVGSYMGGVIYQDIGHLGHAVFIGVIVLTVIAGRGMSLGSEHPSGHMGSELKKTGHAFIAMFRSYRAVLISMSLLWAVSTLAGQEAIKLGINVLGQTQDQATILLLYSAIGVMIGSVIAVRYAASHRMVASYLAGGCFVIVMGTLSTVISVYPVYMILVTAAIVLGVCLGVLINVIEGLFFGEMGVHTYRAYGSALYGLMVNMGVMIVMTGASVVGRWYGEESVFVYGAIVMSIAIACGYPLLRQGWTNRETSS